MTVREDDRAEFLAYVRENHPDAGGDPHEFAEGLARFRSRSSREDDRFDAPVTFTERPSVLARFTRRKSRRGPRVH
ncbi:hypothetical protein BAY61_11380 [Prauserella marina]|uniref:Uncharacterized protein n=1 Tax=Prauserella marina TaxID=530584 RepID=A0A222VNS2_9PSEU|nr:hypothetical protein [Prauserella marina]ASR35502.1 hypothetical protein BAY61_11380 [Prauserella marina]PWV84672.1 hypothetical protein DES30_101690 [Prauserella marina]SDC16128.1 hypothetical protein SAMN05421630_101646 [Prauserella marina]